MYYEEKLINGALHYRTAPNDEWVPVSTAELSQRCVQAETKLREAETARDKHEAERLVHFGEWQKAYARQRELEQAHARVREDLKVADAISGSFFEALKPLKLPAVDVRNPGRHVTELIDENTALRLELEVLKREGRHAGDDE